MGSLFENWTVSDNALAMAVSRECRIAVWEAIAAGMGIALWQQSATVQGTASAAPQG